MDFKALVKQDIEKTMINPAEFADTIVVENSETAAIFDEDHEVVDEAGVVTVQPAFTASTAVSKAFKNGDRVSFEDKSYVIAECQRGTYISTFLLERSEW